MPPRPQRVRITRVELVAALASWALSIVTTAALAAVGWFGHATHWTFGLAGHGGHGDGHGTAAHAGPDHGPQAEAGHGEAPTREADAVHFKSKEAMERTGIELVPVEERPMVSELVASGVVLYDQRHIAQLSARVPGSVWRVEKQSRTPVALLRPAPLCARATLCEPRCRRPDRSHPLRAAET